MKKIFILILMSLSILCCRMTINASISSNSITDKTSIDEDLQLLDLNPSSYISIKDTESNRNDYFSFYVIALGEGRLTQNSIDLYVYIYNPVNITQFKDVEISIRCNDQILILTNNNLIKKSIETGVAKNIYCFKIPVSKISDHRNYIAEYISYDDENYDSTFTAEFIDNVDNGKIDVSFNYDSIFYITDDILVCVTFKDWDTSNWWQCISHDFNFFSDEETVLMYFYNFSCDVEIERIIEVDLVYTFYNYISTAYYDPGTGEHLRELSSSKENEKKDHKAPKLPGIYEQMVYGRKCTFNAFCTPAKKRLDEFSGAVNIFNKNFTEYQHSVLVDINKESELYSTLKFLPKKEVFPLLNVSGNTSVLEKKINTFTITDLKMVRCKYSCDGEIKNAYVIDDPDSPIRDDGSNPKLEKSLIEKFLIWLGEQTLKFLHINTVGIPEQVKLGIGIVEVLILVLIIIPKLLHLLILLIKFLKSIFK